MMKKVETIDEYIALYPAEVQTILHTIRTLIKTIVPTANEAIRYGIPTFQLQGNLVHFGAYKTHIGLYPGPQAILMFKSELTKYPTSKGAIQFPLDKPIPLGIIKKIVQFRVKESTKKIPTKEAR